MIVIVPLALTYLVYLHFGLWGGLLTFFCISVLGHMIEN